MFKIDLLKLLKEYGDVILENHEDKFCGKEVFEKKLRVAVNSRLFYYRSIK